MFSKTERTVYRQNPLAEVICQLRFPTILAIGAKDPVDFQDAIRDVFPQYQRRADRLPAGNMAPGRRTVYWERKRRRKKAGPDLGVRKRAALPGKRKLPQRRRS